MKLLFSSFLVFIVLSFGVYAQDDAISPDSNTLIVNNVNVFPGEKMNIIKLNLLALPIRTFTIQYERVIKKYLSAAIAVRYMPKATMPYKKWVYNRFGDNDPDAEEMLDNLLISNYAFTPEIRFYPGKKGYGKGFYLAPCYRYSRFTIDNLQYTFTDSDDYENQLDMSGTMTTNYGGFTIGVQWFLGEHLSLDWWIFTPLIGGEKTKLTGTTSESLSEEDQNIIREEFEDIDIPYTDLQIEVHEYGANIQFKGLMAGFSAGLALGFRF